jgi:hypothetical protein
MKAIALLAFLTVLAEAGQLPRFREITVTGGLKMGYQLLSVDLNGDGRKDLIAIDERATELAWYENPSWTRHVIATDVPRQLNADAWDTDGDGRPEIVLAYRFESSPERSVGNVALLKSGPDPTQPWSMTEIDRVPTAHRVRFIDFDGDGRKVLLLGPMVGMKAKAPLNDDDVPVYLYRPGEWKRELLYGKLHGILHAIVPVRWQGAKKESLLTASFLGLHRIERLGSGEAKVTQISKGDERECPQCGSSEVRQGRLGRRWVLAAIEPWHGNQVVVYVPEGKRWTRIVLEDGMTNGHGLAVGDLDGDGRDEIVCGFRGKGHKATIYQAEDSKGTKWSSQVLDNGGMAAADCRIEDYTGDGRPDIACAGASTANVKIYENLGPVEK